MYSDFAHVLNFVHLEPHYYKSNNDLNLIKSKRAAYIHTCELLSNDNRNIVSFKKITVKIQRKEQHTFDLNRK